MKRILVVIDASNFKPSLVDFACYLARLTDSKLTGMLFHPHEGKEIVRKSFVGLVTDEAHSELPTLEWQEEYPKTLSLFKEFCCNREVNCDAYVDGDVPMEQLIEETRYADLVVADPGISFSDHVESIPTSFIKELLARSECPVVVAPESFDWINELAFAYDGTRSSVFAMKQFTYMFPELRDKKVIVIEVCEGEEHAISEKEKLTAWLQNYYSNISYLVLYGKPKDELFGYLLEKEKMLVVIGAFGRSMVSSMFSKSNAELLLKAVNLPFFIAHR